MAFLAAPGFATAIGSLAGIAGIATAAKSIIGGSKDSKPALSPQPKSPDPQQAAQKAAEDAKKRRRAVTQTNLTRGKALVPEVNVGRKSLLGE